MVWSDWVLGVIGSIIALTVIWTGRAIMALPADYMPRTQINSRFEALEARLHKDMVSQERRTDKQLDKLDAKLDQILDKLDNKADK